MSDALRAQLRVLAEHLCPGESPEAAYELLTSMLLRYFEWRLHEAPEDLAQETLVRGCLKLGSDDRVTLNADNPTGYFWGIARNVAHEHRRRARTRRTEPLETDVRAASTGIEEVESRLELDQTLAGLSPGDRDILLRYYGDDDRERLCAELGISEATLRVRVFRIRGRLQTAGAAVKQKRASRQ